MDDTRDPRDPDVTIHTGGALWPTPGQIRAELPDDARAQFEQDYQHALRVAAELGDLAQLANILEPWQRRLIHHRAGDYDDILDRARAVRAGEDVGAIPLARLQEADR
ncbi:DUF6247 family protein [Embleya sp. NPDC055664]|uniref:DUF6247 family protein n=1 Tax=Embleya sp. NPDC059237 TaxID=3346784 RepID=UPI0036B1FC19